MSKSKFPKIILLAITLNLLVASVYSFAQSIADLDVTACVSNCLTVEAPASLSINGPIILSNAEKRIYTYGNYSLGQKIQVYDARDNGNFTLDVNIDGLINQSDTAARLNYSDIGILSFNSSATSSVDGRNSSGGALPASSIDPVQNGEASEPFDQNSMSSIATSTASYDNLFTYFSPSTVPTSSDAINIIDTTTGTAASNIGIYSFGLGLIFHIPANSVDSGAMKDGIYTSIITFTLTGF